MPVLTSGGRAHFRKSGTSSSSSSSKTTDLRRVPADSAGRPAAAGRAPFCPPSFAAWADSGLPGRGDGIPSILTPSAPGPPGPAASLSAPVLLAVLLAPVPPKPATSLALLSAACSAEPAALDKSAAEVAGIAAGLLSLSWNRRQSDDAPDAFAAAALAASSADGSAAL